jgi:hypothetical protein
MQELSVNEACVHEGQKANSGSTTMLKTLSLFMAWVVFVNSAYAAKAMANDAASQRQAPVSQESVIQKKLSQIPLGSKVEVRLTSNEKLKGRLEAVSAEGIVLKPAKADQTGDRKIALTEMKSIKTARSTGGRIGLYVLTGIGVFAVVVLILAYAYGMGD